MIIIVGDSFCTQDSKFSSSWTTKLQDYFGDKLINLSYVGASNFGILLQIEKALTFSPNYVIFNSTSSVRHEISIRTQNKKKTSLLDRIVNIDVTDHTRDILSTTYFTANVLGQLNSSQEKEIVNYHKKYSDIDVEVLKNFYFIKYSLDLLIESNCNFIWSQGGFEHSNFNGSKLWNFEKYKKYHSRYNLWDYIDSQICNHHIESQQTHNMIFDYYKEKISDCRQ